MSGPNSSRTRWHTSAARLPPAESPPMATLLASTPSSSKFSTVHGERGHAVLERRRSRVLGGEAVVDRHHDAARRAWPEARQVASAVSRSPITQPPPWNHTSTPWDSPDGGVRGVHAHRDVARQARG